MARDVRRYPTEQMVEHAAQLDRLSRHVDRAAESLAQGVSGQVGKHLAQARRHASQARRNMKASSSKMRKWSNGMRNAARVIERSQAPGKALGNVKGKWPPMRFGRNPSGRLAKAAAAARAAAVGVAELNGYRLPATSGRISTFGGPADKMAGGSFALTGENPAHPNDPWYIAMRWPRPYPKWLKDVRIIVEYKGHRVVVRPADYGPAAWTGRVVDAGPRVLDALGGDTDSVVYISFSTDQSLPLGPMN